MSINEFSIRIDPGPIEREPRGRSDPSRAGRDWYWVDPDDPSIVPWGYFEDDDL